MTEKSQPYDPEGKMPPSAYLKDGYLVVPSAGKHVPAGEYKVNSRGRVRIGEEYVRVLAPAGAPREAKTPKKAAAAKKATGTKKESEPKIIAVVIQTGYWTEGGRPTTKRNAEAWRHRAYCADCGDLALCDSYEEARDWSVEHKRTRHGL